MKPQERDELLIRVDERLKALKDGDEGDIPEIKKHLSAQNGKIFKNRLMIVTILAFLTGMGILELPDIIKLLGG